LRIAPHQGAADESAERLAARPGAWESAAAFTPWGPA